MEELEIAKVEVPTTELIITDHAYERAKERLGWKKQALNKMAKLAFDKGVKHKETKGTLNKYIYKLWVSHKFCNNIKIYGEDIFFFSNNTLITVYRLDNKLIKHLKYCK